MTPRRDGAALRAAGGGITVVDPASAFALVQAWRVDCASKHRGANMIRIALEGVEPWSKGDGPTAVDAAAACDVLRAALRHAGESLALRIRYVPSFGYGTRHGCEKGAPAYLAGVVSHPDLVARPTRAAALDAARIYAADRWPFADIVDDERTAIEGAT